MTAETLTPTPPLAAWSNELDDLPAGVEITPRPFIAMADLKVEPGSLAVYAVAGHLGITLPTTPSTSVENESVTAIWSGPDEWLNTRKAR